MVEGGALRKPHDDGPAFRDGMRGRCCVENRIGQGGGSGVEFDFDLAGNVSLEFSEHALETGG